jgi:hypothetical protein
MADDRKTRSMPAFDAESSPGQPADSNSHMPFRPSEPPAAPTVGESPAPDPLPAPAPAIAAPPPMIARHVTGPPPPAPGLSPWADPIAPTFPDVTNAAVGRAVVRPPSPIQRAVPADVRDEQDASPYEEARPAQSPPLPEQLLQLLWFEPRSMPHVRRRPAWRALLDELEDQPPDSELDDLAADAEEVENFREVFEVLTHGVAHDPNALESLLMGGVRTDGKFVAPLVLLEGDLVFPFDDVERLKATVATVMPFADDDQPLEHAIETANKLIQAAELLAAGDVADALIKRIRDAFGRVRRLVTADYLNEQTERALLEKRHYQRRELFGAKHIRALLLPHGSDDLKKAAPAYLPDDLAKGLPMFQRFRTRMIAEVQLPVDQYETHATALRVVALARVSRRRM